MGVALSFEREALSCIHTQLFLLKTDPITYILDPITLSLSSVRFYLLSFSSSGFNLSPTSGSSPESMNILSGYQ